MPVWRSLALVGTGTGAKGAHKTTSGLGAFAKATGDSPVTRPRPQVTTSYLASIVRRYHCAILNYVHYDEKFEFPAKTNLEYFAGQI